MDVLRYLSGFFSFSGRIGRLDFWIFFAVFTAGLMALVMFAKAAPGNALTYLLGSAILVTLGVAFFATGVRRLHDRAYSGWMIIIFYAIPLYMGSENRGDTHLIGFRIDIGSFEEGWFLRLVASVIVIWAIVELFILRGTVGPNKYGPDPLEPASTSAQP